MRSPKAKKEARVARAAERAAYRVDHLLTAAAPGDLQLARLIERGHGHCAEAKRLEKGAQS